METAAVAIPIPVQPIAPPQPAPGTPGSGETGEAAPADFASALAQQLVLGAAAAALPAPLDPAAAEETPAETADAPAAGDGTAPDALIALLPAPLAVGAAQALPAGPAAPRQPGTAPERGAIAVTGERRADIGRGEARGASTQTDRPRTSDYAPVDAERSTGGQAPEAHAPVQPHGVDAVVAALVSPQLHVPATATSHATAAAAAPAGPAVAARVGTAEWSDGLAQQVTLMVKEGEQTAQLRLDPPELGPLEVRLSMARGDDSVAHAQFVSPHAAVREALEAALPQLRAALADNGITLGQASVGEGYAREDHRNAQQPEPGAGHARGEETRSAAPAPRMVVRHGLVDTFA